MAPSRKHFRAIAEAVSESTNDSEPNSLRKDRLVSKLASILAEANPSFNSTKIRAACYENVE